MSEVYDLASPPYPGEDGLELVLVRTLLSKIIQAQGLTKCMQTE